MYKIEKVYNQDSLSVAKVLNEKGKICKAVFYDEKARVSNMSVYNADTGKEIKNITYKSDGKTVSSVRIYNEKNNKIERVAFYKADGKHISSMVLYDETGRESQCIMFCDDGEIIKFSL